MKFQTIAARAAVIALVATTFLSIAAKAQVPDVATEPPSADVARSFPAVTLLRQGIMGELLTVYVPRTDVAIQRSLGFAHGELISVDAEMDAARRLALEAEGRVRVIKAEIETSKIRRNTAKKTKDDAARGTLDEIVKKQERERDYLQKVHESLRADTDRLESERVAADAWVKALELETVVVRTHAGLATVDDPAPDAVTDYERQLRQMLEARRLAADRWRLASEKRKILAERRLKQLDGLADLEKR